MRPKEKAKELYCKYTDALNIRDLQTTANPFAKQCALIAVDEIIEFMDRFNLDVEGMKHQFNWWKQVKQEIELL